MNSDPIPEILATSVPVETFAVVVKHLTALGSDVYASRRSRSSAIESLLRERGLPNDTVFVLAVDFRFTAMVAMLRDDPLFNRPRRHCREPETHSTQGIQPKQEHIDAAAQAKLEWTAGVGPRFDWESFVSFLPDVHFVNVTLSDEEVRDIRRCIDDPPPLTRPS